MGTQCSCISTIQIHCELRELMIIALGHTLPEAQIKDQLRSSS
jgi:hypothetical protein